MQKIREVLPPEEIKQINIKISKLQFVGPTIDEYFKKI